MLVVEKMYRNVALIRWAGVLITVLCGLSWMHYYWSRRPYHPTVMQSVHLTSLSVLCLMSYNIILNIVREWSPLSWGWRRPDLSFYSELEKNNMPRLTLDSVLNVVYGSGFVLFSCFCCLSGQQILSYYWFCCALFILCVWDWYDPVPNPPTPPNAANNILISACMCVLGAIVNLSVSPSLQLELSRMNNVSTVVVGMVYPFMILLCLRERHDFLAPSEEVFVEVLEISSTFVYAIGIMVAVLGAPYQDPLIYDLSCALTVTISPLILFLSVIFVMFNVFKGNTIDILSACCMAMNLQDIFFHGFKEERLAALFVYNVAVVFRIMGTTPGGCPSQQEVIGMAQLDELSLSVSSTTPPPEFA